MSSVLKFTDVPDGKSVEEHLQEEDAKKAKEQEAQLKEEQKKLDEMVSKSNGGTEQMLRRLQRDIDPELLDKFQIICSRVRWVDPDKKTVLWLHDLPGDPESQHLQHKDSRDRFDAIVCVSDWQMQQYNNYLGLPYKESMVIKNAIEPIVFDEKTFDGQVRMIYHTTPHRGLEILVPVFEELYKTYGDKIHLDIFSSFSIYGWDERDEPYKGIFERADKCPGITNHGYKPHDEVVEALKKSHIFAYPSIWPETSCLAAIEAMSARNVVVCPNLAALPETTAPWSYMYQWSEDKQDHANRFGQALMQVVDEFLDEKTTQQILNSTVAQKQVIDSSFDWKGRIDQWNQLLTGIANDKG